MLVTNEEDRRHRFLTRRITSFRRVGDLYRRDQEVHRQRLIARSEAGGPAPRYRLSSAYPTRVWAVQVRAGARRIDGAQAVSGRGSSTLRRRAMSTVGGSGGKSGFRACLIVSSWVEGRSSHVSEAVHGPVRRQGQGWRWRPGGDWPMESRRWFDFS